MTPRRVRLVLLLAAVALLAAAFAAPNASALSLKRAVAVDSAWAPAYSATVHPGRPGLHRRRPVHLQLRLPGRRRRLPRPGGPLLGHRRTDRNRRLHQRLAAARARRSKSTGASKPGTLAYNSWLAMQAAGETDPDACAYNDFALIQDRPGRRRQGQPLGPGLRRPDRRRQRPAKLGSTRLLLRQLRTAARDHQAEPEAGRRPPERRQWLEPRRRHPDARRARRLGQRLPQRLGRGDRRAQHPPARAARRHQRRRRPRQGARLRRAPTASRACSSSPAPSRSKPNLVGAILGA